MDNSSVNLERVSTKEQADGYSLKSQKKGNEHYSGEKGYDTKKTFTIHETASKSEQRKIFKQMMEYVEKHNIKHIVCEKVDRFSRSIVEAKLIYDWLEADEKRNLHFVKESLIVNKNSKSHEKFNLNIKVTMAQFYADNLSEEVRKGQDEKIAQNWYPGRTKLGYRTVEVNGHNIQTPDEKVAPLLKRVLELFSTGDYSVQTSAKTAYEDGLRSKKGNKIYPGGIYRFLKDPFYHGDFKWNGAVYHGKHEKLIEKEVFDRNQSLLRRKNAPKYTIHAHLFKGLTACVECNHSISWETHKHILYGYCNRYTPCTQINSIKEDEIEEKLIVYLEYLKINNKRIVEWVRKAITEGYKDDADYHEQAIQTIQADLQQSQRKLKTLLDMRINEEIDKATYQVKFKELLDEKEKLEDASKNHSQNQTRFAQYSVSFYELSQRAKEIYVEAKEVKDKKGLLKFLFTSIKVNTRKKEIEPVLTPPFQIIKDLVDYTNEISSKVVKNGDEAVGTFEKGRQLITTAQLHEFLLAHSELRRG